MHIQEIIDSQIEVMSELNDLLDMEKEILIKDRASELQDIVDRKKEKAQRIAFLEKERQKCYGTKKAEELVDEGLLSRTRLEELTGYTDMIRQKNETNMALTKQSLNYIKMIRYALDPSPKIVTYGNNGKVGDSKSMSVFNTKV